MKKKVTYSQVGDNYDTKDPVKKLAQSQALHTKKNLKLHGFEEVSQTRGESAYVWRQGNVYMASVVEGLGTKTLIADAMRSESKTYYDNIAHDTVATIINDLASVGARPLTVNAYWAIEDNEWLLDKKRIKDLILGWKNACNLSGASWGGGETATMKQIVVKNTCELAGAAVGIIPKKKYLITENHLEQGDRILFLKSSGVNANGISLARAIAKKLPKGYKEKLPSGLCYAEALLEKSHIYARLIQALQEKNITLHYITHITGHGMLKVMRAKQAFTYIVENVFEPHEIFHFIQKHAGLSDEEMYKTYNMGQDYALFLPKKGIKKAQAIITSLGFESIDAGYIEKGRKQVLIKPKNIVLHGDQLNLR